MTELEKEQETKEIIPTEQEPEERAADESTLLGLLRKYRRFLLGGMAGVAVACLFMWLGFWKTVFILAMAAIGGYVFGVDRKVDRFKNLLNKLFPPRS